MEPSCHSRPHGEGTHQSFESKWSRGGGEEDGGKRAEGDWRVRGEPQVGWHPPRDRRNPVSGQTVLRVVRRIVTDPDSRELSQTAFSSTRRRLLGLVSSMVFSLR